MTRSKMLTATAILISGLFLAQAGGGQESVRPSQTNPALAPYDPQKKIPADALREDLKILWDVMEEGHGGFVRYTPESVLKKSFDDVMSGLAAPMTEFDFFLRLMPLIAEIKDGHTRVQPSAAAGAYLDDQAVFPFGLRFLGGRAYAFRNLSGDGGIQEGAELLAVNGMPVEEIVAELLPLIPNDAGIPTRKLRQLEFPANFGRLFALRFGRPDSFRIRFRPYRSSDVKETTVPGIKGKDVVRILNERYPDAAKRPPLYELSFRGATAVLTIRSFADEPEKGSTPYPDFLKKTFRALEEKKTANLIIDLRDNGGGADEYGKLLFAYVMDRPFLYYQALETKKDRYDLFKYAAISSKEAAELAKQVKKNARGWFDVLGHPNLGLQQPQSPRFTGKIAILVNGLSFSATGETTSLFHYYKKAVFFGEECGAGYYGNTSGFMVMVTLPHTKIQARVPLILYTMAVDGYPKDRGIVPDFPVTPSIEDLMADRDPVMDRALTFLSGAERASAQELLDAVKAGDLAKVRMLVEKDPGVVNARNPGGQTILFAAVSFGRLEIADYLVSQGADVNVRMSFHLTPLHVACLRSAPLAVVRLLAEKGADVNAVAEYSGRPLDLALDGGDAAVIDYLKSKGARPTPLEFETFRLADRVGRIAYPWGMRNNIVVFSGPDGILLVDTGFSKHAVDTLRQTIAGLAKGEIRYIVNTHPHGDHVDGNGIAPAGAIVINATGLESPDLKNRISHSNRPLRGRAGRELAAPFIMRFNGEDIQIIPNPGLHSQEDILVYFAKSRIVCMGDLLLAQNCPAVQDVGGYMAFLDKVLDVFPAGTTFVSGHGKDLTRDGLMKYRDDLAGMIAIVRKNYAAGKSADNMLRDDVLKAYKSGYSFLDWIGPDSWLERVCQALQSGSLK